MTNSSTAPLHSSPQSRPPATDHSPDFEHYPSGFRSSVILRVSREGNVILRPIAPEDEPAMRRFHEALSEETIYDRYFEHFSLEGRIDHQRLARVCANTANSFALVAEQLGVSGRPAEILAVGRLIVEEPYVASFALLVRDDARSLSLDGAVLRRLITLARAFGFQLLVDDNLVSNHDLLNLCRKLGFSLHTIPDEGLVRVSLRL